VTRLHHRWGAPEADIFVFKFLPWPGFEPQTSQSNGREHYYSTTVQCSFNMLNRHSRGLGSNPCQG